MSSSANFNPHSLLHLNLTILQVSVPGDPPLKECVKEGMFAQPNRNGFERVMHYLLKAYNPIKTRTALFWPIVDRRTEERRFRKEVVVLVNEVIQENPDFLLPNFSPSFLTTPGGDRFAKFMWKLSLLVLKVVTERIGGEDCLLLERPTQGLHIMTSLRNKHLMGVQRDVSYIGVLLLDASTFAKKLCKDIIIGSEKCKKAQADLLQCVGDIDEHIVNHVEKSALLNSNKESFDKVLKDWGLWADSVSNALNSEFHTMRNQLRSVKSCVDSAKALIESPVQLKAPDIPEVNGNLSLNFLFSETAAAVAELHNTFSAFGGLPSFNVWESTLKNIFEELHEIESTFSRVNTNIFQLLSTADSSIDKPLERTENDSLKVEHKILQEATSASPALTFEQRSDLSYDMSISESPVSINAEDTLLKTRKGFRTLNLANRFPEGSSYLSSPSIKTQRAFQKTSSSFPETPHCSHFRPKYVSTSLKLPPTPKSTVSETSKSCKRVSSNHIYFSKPTQQSSSSQPFLNARDSISCQNGVKLTFDSEAQSQSLLDLVVDTVQINPSEEFELERLGDHDNLLYSTSRSVESKISLGKRDTLSDEQSEKKLIQTESKIPSVCFTPANPTKSGNILLSVKPSMSEESQRKAADFGNLNTKKNLNFSRETIKETAVQKSLKTDNHHSPDQISSKEFSDVLSNEFDSPSSSPVESLSCDQLFISSDQATFLANDNDITDIEEGSCVDEIDLNDNDSAEGSNHTSCKVAETNKADEDVTNKTNFSSRRKSLQAIIDKYHKYMASIKEAENRTPSEPSHDSIDDEDFNI